MQIPVVDIDGDGDLDVVTRENRDYFSLSRSTPQKSRFFGVCSGSIPGDGMLHEEFLHRAPLTLNESSCILASPLSLLTPQISKHRESTGKTKTVCYFGYKFPLFFSPGAVVHFPFVSAGGVSTRTSSGHISASTGVCRASNNCQIAE